MKTKKVKVRQGFTIVELVIVIGVIGVLSAVLIPTFINLNAKAQAASDQSFIKNINTQLAINETEQGKNRTMTEAVNDALAMGFDVRKLTPVNGNDVIWDAASDRFALINSEENKIVYSEGAVTEKLEERWAIVKNIETETPGLKKARPHFKASFLAQNGYSLYIADETFRGTLRVTSGIDVGENEKINVEYTAGTAGKNVTIRTNGGTLKINAAGDHVTHYGFADSIKNEETQSYRELGYSSFLQIDKGNATIESDVGTLYVSSANVNVKVNAGVSISASLAASAEAQEKISGAQAEIVTEEQVEDYRETATRYAGGLGTEEKPYLIATKTHVNSFEEDIYAGESDNYYKLINDINLKDAYMFGSIHYESYGDGSNALEADTIFEGGHFDGGGHTLNYKINAQRASNAGVGLFTCTKNSSFKNLNIIADLDATSPTIQNPFVGGLVGYAIGDLVVENVTISGTIKAKRDVGGFVGVHEGADGEDQLRFTNCKSNVEITMTSSRTGFSPIGGYVGQAYTRNASFVGCTSNNKLSVKKANNSQYPCASYFVGFASDNKMADDNYGVFAFSNCKVGESASFSSEIGYTAVKGGKTIYCTPTSENIGHCAGSAYLGSTSGMDSGAAPKISMTINGAAFDTTKYIAA